ncbi:acetate kinase [Clostridia bacterium]|nr:acetate kinase [Clostridia bacterium]
MKVLVINCGSSSLKFQLIDSATEALLAKGLCERIGLDGSQLVYQPEGGEKEKSLSPMPTHTQAVSLVLAALHNDKTGVIKDLSEIGAIGHRIVHGGEKIAQSSVITDELLQIVEDCNDLAPLHNPANLIGIHACREVLPQVPMVAVFDTAFHQTMPEHAYLYGLPYELYTDHQIRKYGFHGTSHQYVSKRAAQLVGRPYENLKTIVCHLGNGASICAVKDGISIDTSMGMTPLEGLVMGTRSGDIDPGVLDFLQKKAGLNWDEIIDMLNKKSGVFGISGISSDFRDLEAAAEKNDPAGKRALDVYEYRVAKYIGSYVAAMNGVDVICFTAGIGENGPDTRANVCAYLGYLGIEIDKEANAIRGQEKLISTADSKVKVYCLPTNEELAIARETVALVK